jgi:hypothetical protein
MIICFFRLNEKLFLFHKILQIYYKLSAYLCATLLAAAAAIAPTMSSKNVWQ